MLNIFSSCFTLYLFYENTKYCIPTNESSNIRLQLCTWVSSCTTLKVRTNHLCFLLHISCEIYFLLFLCSFLLSPTPPTHDPPPSPAPPPLGRCKLGKPCCTVASQLFYAAGLRGARIKVSVQKLDDLLL